MREIGNLRGSVEVKVFENCFIVYVTVKERAMLGVELDEGGIREEDGGVEEAVAEEEF